MAQDRLFSMMISPKKTPIADREDLLMIDGYRILALAWIMVFGAA